MHDEEYFETFAGSPEEQENYDLRNKVESQLTPHYIDKMVEIASAIAESPPKNLDELLNVSTKLRDISNKVQEFSTFLDTFSKLSKM